MQPCNPKEGDKATVSRIEAGLTVPDKHFAEVCSAAFRNDWFTRFWADSQAWDATFPAEFREFAEYEAEATSLWLFEHTMIPGLIQTEDYARAVLERHVHVTPGGGNRAAGGAHGAPVRSGPRRPSHAVGSSGRKRFAP